METSSPSPRVRAARVLVTGAAGFVGRAVAARLVADGRSVAGMVRAPSTLPAGVKRLVVGDLTAIGDWPARLAGFDAVVHCAARAHVLAETASDPVGEFRRHNAELPAAIARGASEAGVRRIVFLSTIGVLGDRTHGRGFRHDDPPAPHSPYAEAKLAAERALAAIAAETGLEVVVIRPPLVIGAQPPGNLGSLARAIRRGLLLPFASVTGNRRDLVSVDTLADLVSRALDHPGAAGETLLAADGRPLSTRGIVEALGEYAGKRPRLVSFPSGLLATALRLAGRGAMAAQLFGDLEVDIAHTRRVLDWVPPADRTGQGEVS